VIRLAVLASGGGTNLQAILDGCAAGRLDARVAVVLSNAPAAFALERARRAGVPVEVVPSKGATDREAYDRSLVERLSSYRPDLVCLAGYLRLLTPTFLSAFGPGPATRGCPRVMNIHPALLPAFAGLHVQRAALEHGARFSGCTVHFVDEGTDSGPIIAQAVVPLLPEDTEESLAARILSEEHRLYPQCVQWYAEGRLSLAGRRVAVSGARPADLRAVFNPPLE
jgi:phosphoribosylglycinamide formyltransferase 1